MQGKESPGCVVEDLEVPGSAARFADVAAGATCCTCTCCCATAQCD